MFPAPFHWLHQGLDMFEAWVARRRSLMASQASPSPPAYRESAASPSPPAQGLRDGGYLIRIPPVRKTGDVLADEEAQANMDSLAGMVQQLIAAPRHVGPLNSNLQKRIATESDQVQAEQGLTFPLTELSLKNHTI